MNRKLNKTKLIWNWITNVLTVILNHFNSCLLSKRANFFTKNKSYCTYDWSPTFPDGINSKREEEELRQEINIGGT